MFRVCLLENGIIPFGPANDFNKKILFVGVWAQTLAMEKNY